MKKYVCVVFAYHGLVKQNYLFVVEPMTRLKRGDKVSVETMYGQRQAVCACDSFVVDEHALQCLVDASGAYLPLKRVIGTVKEEVVRKDVVTPLSNVPDDLPF